MKAIKLFTRTFTKPTITSVNNATIALAKTAIHNQSRINNAANLINNNATSARFNRLFTTANPMFAMGATSHTDETKLSKSNRDPGWFPKCRADLDKFTQETLEYGAELDADHPGFHDQEYRKRRLMIADIALNYKHGDKHSALPIPRVDYTEKETETWRTIFTKLCELAEQHACENYNKILPTLGFTENEIPQLEDITQTLSKRTGWILRPVGGLLSPRDFLNGLAFRVFHSTQYIRHHTAPLYTPEPDIVHELMGHVPLFADPDFAEFSQQIGLASLGVSDEDIKKLATVYWFSVEFGVCKEGNSIKAYGAGILSSFGEIEHAIVQRKPEIRPFDPFVACKQEYPITTYQPVLFCAESFADATERVKEFSKSLKRNFEIKYNRENDTVTVEY